MRILITGAQGNVAQEIINLFSSGGCHLGNIPKSVSKSEIYELSKNVLDITNYKKVFIVLSSIKPDVIINCASFTNVDNCEKYKDMAFKVNALGARNIAMASERINCKLIHLSTDYVFNGESGESLKEYDLVNPINTYGKSKLLGENYIREFCSKYFIVRTSWMYGKYGDNFVRRILRIAKEKGGVEVVSDQFGTPTNALELSYHILNLAETNEFGIYHCSGNSHCSWYDFAKEIIKVSKINSQLKPINSDELKRVANRPKYSVLDNMMLRCTIGDNMYEWRESLGLYLKSVEI